MRPSGPVKLHTVGATAFQRAARGSCSRPGLEDGLIPGAVTCHAQALPRKDGAADEFATWQSQCPLSGGLDCADERRRFAGREISVSSSSLGQLRGDDSRDGDRGLSFTRETPGQDPVRLLVRMPGQDTPTHGTDMGLSNGAVPMKSLMRSDNCRR